MFAQRQGPLCFSLCLPWRDQGVCTRLRGDTARQMECSMPYNVMLSNTIGKKRRFTESSCLLLRNWPGISLPGEAVSDCLYIAWFLLFSFSHSAFPLLIKQLSRHTSFLAFILFFFSCYIGSVCVGGKSASSCAVLSCPTGLTHTTNLFRFFMDCKLNWEYLGSAKLILYRLVLVTEKNTHSAKRSSTKATFSHSEVR